MSSLRAHNFKDHTGKVFGRWTVIRFHDVVKETRKARWVAQCSCGQERIVQIGNLKNHKSRSCGCYNIEQISKRNAILKPRTYRSYVSYAWHSYLSKATARGLPWNLTQDEFRVLLTGVCFYCGVAPSRRTMVAKFKRKNGQYVTRIAETLELVNGIDRMNSIHGYSIKNCVSCCLKCNQIKMDMSCGEFLEHVAKIVQHKTLCTVKMK